MTVVPIFQTLKDEIGMRPYLETCPHPNDLRWSMKVLGILDTVLCERPELRYHTYLANRFPQIDVGIIDTGAGDHLLCFFSDQYGILIKGFDHQSKLSPHVLPEGKPLSGIYDEVPPELLTCLEADEFLKNDVTFCLWRKPKTKQWFQGDVTYPPDTNDGSRSLLGTIYLTAEDYLHWARDYYKQSVPEEPVKKVYDEGTISLSLAQTLNAAVNLETLKQELRVIGVDLG
jgi:hypothetical protein